MSERATLLQKIHFDRFMDGYDVYVGPRGEVGTRVSTEVGAFQVRKTGVSFAARTERAIVAGSAVVQGDSVPLHGDVAVQVGKTRLEYRELSHVTAEGWPYLAEVRRPPVMTFLKFGAPFRIGRGAACEIPLPNAPHTKNILWNASVGNGEVIKSSTGDIPKMRFYTDSVMVATEHAVITPDGDEAVADGEMVGEVRVACLARSCHVYLRRGNEILTLFPTAAGRQPTETTLQSGDHLLVGNAVFQVSWGAAIAGPLTRPSSDSDGSAGAFPTIGVPRGSKGG